MWKKLRSKDNQRFFAKLKIESIPVNYSNRWVKAVDISVKSTLSRRSSSLSWSIIVKVQLPCGRPHSCGCIRATADINKNQSSVQGCSKHTYCTLYREHKHIENTIAVASPARRAITSARGQDNTIEKGGSTRYCTTDFKRFIIFATHSVGPLCTLIGRAIINFTQHGRGDIDCLPCRYVLYCLLICKCV